MLLIEDNPADARLVREVLAEVPAGSAPFDLHWAERLQSGFAILAEKSIDVVLLDLSLPESQGLPTLARLRSQVPDMPIIVLTGLKDERTALEALQMGAQDYVDKNQIQGNLLARSIRYAIERAQIRIEIHREEERYRDLFENANDILCTLDLSGRFTAINKKGEELLGYSRNELMGRELATLAAPGSAKDAHGSWLYAEPESPAVPHEMELLTKSGATLPLEASARTVFDQGQPAGIQAILRDIRGRRRLEAQLQQGRKMEALGRLAGGVAHDFNNLLTIISGHAEVYLEISKDPQARDHLLAIIKASDRAASLTRQLLAFSRKQFISPQVVDVGRLLTELSKMLRRLIAENIELTVNVVPDLGRIKADPSQIEQVIMNLAINARDAMPDGGKLTIEASNATMGERDPAWRIDLSPGEYILLTVGDSGSGMTAETRERIFEPFFTTKEAGQGTGLGLAIVYGIVKQSRGDIWVYSEIDHGTTFKIYLPRVPENSATSLENPEVLPPRHGTETILVVEDEKSLRVLIENILCSWGYTVLSASTGQEALKIYNEHPGKIDIVMTDMIMPGMSGRELISQVRRLGKETRFVCMSGYPGEAPSKNELGEEGALNLQKPFMPSQLSSILRQILG